MTFKMTSLCFTKVYICILASQALGLLVDHKAAAQDYDWGEPDHPADIKPMNPVVFYGEILRLNCTLHAEINDVSALEMYFEITGINTTWTIKEGLKVTSRSIEADINITKEFYITTNVDCRTTKKSLRTTYIKADNPIQNITDFMGTYYYKDKIEVTWNLANTYWSTQVNTNWYFGSAPELNYSLPCSTATDTSCAIAERGYNGASKLFFKITVNLTLSNTAKRNTSFLIFELPSSASAIHSFNVDDHIKSGPPSDLTITHKTSTCFNFTWRNPEYIDLCKMCPRFYQIEFKEDMMKWMGENSTTLAPYPQANSSIALCHLKPFTTYTLRFQVKGRIQQPWSDWTYITGSTNEDRPLYGPNLTETSFYEEKCTELNERKVYIYWQEPTVSLLQGVLTYYEVEINNATDLLRKGSNYYIADLNCETDYNISIYAATKVGKSLQPSSIFIPARSKEIPVIKDLQFKVEEKFNIQLSSTVKNISATWDTSSADPLDELELYYCEEYYIPKICYDDYTTVVVNLSVGFLEIQNMNIKKNLFGYALKHPDKRLAGIHWTDCVYRADVEPKAPSGFQVNPGDVGSLTLTWRSEPCSKDTKTLILYYHISICSKPEFNGESCTNVTLNSSASNYTAYDLIEKHDYTVYLWAESVYKQGPKRSIIATTRHKDDVSDTTATVIIAVVVSLGVAAGVAAVIIIYCMCRKSKKRVKEFYKPALTASSEASLTNNNYLAGMPTESQVVVPLYTEHQEVLATYADNLYDVPLEPENKATVAVKSETQGIEADEPENQAIVAIESDNQPIVPKNQAIVAMAVESENQAIEAKNQAIVAIEAKNQAIVATEAENQARVVPPCPDTALKQPKPSSHVCDPEDDSNSLNEPNNSEGMNRQVEEYIRMAHHGDTNLATTDLHLSSPSEITLTSDKLKHPFHEIDVFYIREDIMPKNVRDAGRNVTNRKNHDLTQHQTEKEEAIDPEQSVPEYVSINSTSPDIDASCSRNNGLHLISDQFSKPPITDLPVLAQDIEDIKPVVTQVHSFSTSTNNMNTLDYLPVPTQVNCSPTSTNNMNTLDYLPVPTQVISSPTSSNNMNTLDYLPVATQVTSSPTLSNNVNTLDYLPVATQVTSSPTSSNCSPTSSNNIITLDYLPVPTQVTSSPTSSNNMNTLDYLPVATQVTSSPTSSNNMNTLDYLPVATQVTSSPTSSNNMNSLDYLPVLTALLNQQREFITEDDSSSNVSDDSSVMDISFGTNTSYLVDESVLQDLPTILDDPSQPQYSSSGGLHNGVGDPSQHQYNSSGGLHNGVSDPSDSQYNSSDSMESDSLHNSETTEHLLHNGYISQEYPNEVEYKSPVPIGDVEKVTNKLHNGYVSNMFSNNSWDQCHNTPGV